jgi:phytoene dehydrogenase-like protein
MKDSPDYDVVVIGAGCGGLSAGALLAGQGRRVLVLDQNDTVGGCASIFERDGYRFDVGASIVEVLERRRAISLFSAAHPCCTPAGSLNQITQRLAGGVVSARGRHTASAHGLLRVARPCCRDLAAQIAGWKNCRLPSDRAYPAGGVRPWFFLYSP